jgi:hypothetical protein
MRQRAVQRQAIKEHYVSRPQVARAPFRIARHLHTEQRRFVAAVGQEAAIVRSGQHGQWTEAPWTIPQGLARVDLQPQLQHTLTAFRERPAGRYALRLFAKERNFKAQE